MDRRQRKTRTAIFGAFTRLLEKKNYSSLTIQDIIDEADIGRTTFYAHFETKDELLKAICSDIFEHVFSDEIMEEKKHDFSEHNSFQDKLTHILYHLREEQESIGGILTGECGEVFMRYLKEYLYRIFDGRLSGSDEIPKEYRLHLAVGSFAEMVRWWLKGHNNYTPEQISEYYFKSVNV